VLVRHGESEWNAAGILQGHGGPGLTARGRAQATATARALARFHAGATAIVRSDLVRVAETAAATEEILPALPVRIDERLRELDVGAWTGRSRTEVATTDADTFSAWARGEDVAAGGGETFAALRARVVAALDDVVARARRDATDRIATVLVFTHGGPIRVAVAAGLGLPAGGHRGLESVGNCAVSLLDAPTAAALARGMALLAAYNRTGHLLWGTPG
jgi:glucosyl-3-phosphoglycerate phosphatase